MPSPDRASSSSARSATPGRISRSAVTCETPPASHTTSALQSCGGRCRTSPLHQPSALFAILQSLRTRIDGRREFTLINRVVHGAPTSETIDFQHRDNRCFQVIRVVGAQPAPQGCTFPGPRLISGRSRKAVELTCWPSRHRTVVSRGRSNSYPWVVVPDSRVGTIWPANHSTPSDDACAHRLRLNRSADVHGCVLHLEQPASPAPSIAADALIAERHGESSTAVSQSRRTSDKTDGRSLARSPGWGESMFNRNSCDRRIGPVALGSD